MPGRPCCDGTRIFPCAIVTGLLFAALAGLQAGQSLDGDATGTRATVQFGFAPAPAMIGFLAGALVGVLVGLLWTRPGFVGLVGMAFVAGIGGLTGLAVAALVGAETRTVVAGNSVSMEHGAPPVVLAVGLAVGVILGALAGWQFRPGTASPATPSARSGESD